MISALLHGVEVAHVGLQLAILRVGIEKVFHDEEGGGAEEQEAGNDKGHEAGDQIVGEGHNQPAELGQLAGRLKGRAEAAAQDVGRNGREEGQHQVGHTHAVGMSAEETEEGQARSHQGNAQTDEHSVALVLCLLGHGSGLLVAVEFHFVVVSVSHDIFLRLINNFDF